VPGRRSAVLEDADSLAGLAYREYGDAGLWRAIAEANDVEDPARVPVGTRLLVPPRTQAVGGEGSS
jgi:nucleoid-associated protein YgaU